MSPARSTKGGVKKRGQGEEEQHDVTGVEAKEASGGKRVCRGGAHGRESPNILVTGTPGTGKSLLCSRLLERQDESFKLRWINVGEFARERGHLGQWDPDFECHELEEDSLLDDLEEPAAAGGLVVDHHVTDFFPERFFDAVFVLRAESERLYDRLKERGYAGKKLENNMQCEIFQTVLDEARESYREEIVHELRSDNLEELEQNVSRIRTWMRQWRIDNSCQQK